MALTFLIIPGKTFTDGEAVTYAKLNQLGAPTIQVLDDTISVIVPDGSVTLAKVADGIFTADVSGRAKFADSFVNAAKIEALAVTFAKLDTDFIADATAKATPIAADMLAVADSAASNATKRSTVAEVFLAGLTDRVNTATAAVPASAGLATIAHGLAARPFCYQVMLECLTNDAASGWEDGDELELNSVTAYALYPLFAVYADATNIYCRRSSQTAINVAHKTTGVLTAVTDAANFQIKIYAA